MVADWGAGSVAEGWVVADLAAGSEVGLAGSAVADWWCSWTEWTQCSRKDNHQRHRMSHPNGSSCRKQASALQGKSWRQP